MIDLVGRFESEIFRRSAEKFVHRLTKQIFPRAIHQSQSPVGIKCENGDIDLGHDRAQERGCFERAETLHAQGLAKRVYFEKNFAERIVPARAASADRVIAFPQRREKIAHRLQRMNHGSLGGKIFGP